MRGAIVKGIVCLLIVFGFVALNACGQNVSIIMINNTPMIFVDGNLSAISSHDSDRAPLAISSNGETYWDYGDAPDPPYPTLPDHNGARHDMLGVQEAMFSLLEDSSSNERAGLPTTKWAVGDDDDFGDDEDGIAFDRTLVPGHQTKIKIRTSSSTGQAKLNAWVDFNRDGDWADKGEQIFKDVSVTDGDNNLEFRVPCNARSGLTYARFRINVNGGLSYDGPADDGEVQDYLVKVRYCPQMPIKPHVPDDSKEDFAIVVG